MSATTSTPVRVKPAAGLRLTPAEVVLTRRLLNEMWKVVRWFWPVALTLTFGTGLTIAAFTPVTQSFWENAAQWPRWWLFAMGVALTATQLPMAVLHGVTRRAVIRSLLVSAALISMIWALFMVLGHVIEQFLFDRMDWQYALETPHLFHDGYDVLPIFVEFTLIFLGYQLSGALIGGLYYRFGAWRGTLLIPVGLLPAAAMEALLSTGWFGAGLQDGLSVDRPSAIVLTLRER